MLPRCVDDASTGAPGDTYPADLIAFVASLEATGEPPRRIALSPSLARDNVSAFVAWARALTKPPPHLQTGDSNR